MDHLLGLSAGEARNMSDDELEVYLKQAEEELDRTRDIVFGLQGCVQTIEREKAYRNYERKHL